MAVSDIDAETATGMTLRQYKAAGRFSYPPPHPRLSLPPCRPGREGRVRAADERKAALPTPPSHTCGAGHSLSPLKGGEGT
jgi:hypothetical protein